MIPFSFKVIRYIQFITYLFCCCCWCSFYPLCFSLSSQKYYVMITLSYYLGLSAVLGNIQENEERFYCLSPKFFFLFRCLKERVLFTKVFDFSTRNDGCWFHWWRCGRMLVMVKQTRQFASRGAESWPCWDYYLVFRKHF